MKSHEFRTTEFSFLAEMLFQMMQDFPEKLSNSVFPALLFVARVCSARSQFKRNSTKTQEGTVKYKKQMLRLIQALIKHSQQHVCEASASEPDHHTHTHTYVPTYKQQSGSCRPSPSGWTGGSRTPGWNNSLWKRRSSCDTTALSGRENEYEHGYSEVQTHSLQPLPSATTVVLTSTVMAGKTPMVMVKTKHTERAITQI